MPNVLLKLLVKDKPLYSGKVLERRERNLRGERNEVRVVERQTGSRGKRLKITADKDQPACKVSS